MINKKNTIILLLVVLLGLCLRFYHLNQGLLFVYDQGRDAIKVHEILSGNFTLIGPTTGLPGVFLGPFYYYFIAPWYWLGGGNPLYPSVFLLVLNYVVGGFLVYKLTQLVIPKISPVLVFFMLAVSFYHVETSKWLSNPTPLITLAPLYFYLLYWWLKNSRHAILTGLVLALCLQTELAAAIFFIPVTGVLFLYNLITKKSKINFLALSKYMLGLLLGLSPLIIFNWRHDNLIINALLNSFADQDRNTTLIQVWRERPKMFINLFANYLAGSNIYLFVLLLGGVLVLPFVAKLKKDMSSILYAWLFIPLICLLFYTGNYGSLWNYYLIAQYLAFLTILTLFFSWLYYRSKTGFMVLLFLYVIFNLKHYYNTAKADANQISLQNYLRVIDTVYSLADGQPFNVEVFVPNLQPDAYHYLFSWYGKKKYGYLPSPEIKENLFFVMELGVQYYQGDQYWRNWWYDQRKDNSAIISSQKVGIIEIEERQR